MHATSLRRAGAVALFGLWTVTIAACGSSGPNAIETTGTPTPTLAAEPATASSTAPAGTDDPSTDEVVVDIKEPDTNSFHDLSLALDGLDSYASHLSADEHDRFEHLKAAVADAEQATGEDAASAIAQVQTEVAELHAQLTGTSRDLDADTLEAWERVHAQFEEIEAAL